MPKKTKKDWVNEIEIESKEVILSKEKRKLKRIELKRIVLKRMKKKEVKLRKI